MAGKNIFRFIILILIQVLVLNNVHINGLVYPAFYVYFILLLPFETAGWLLLSGALFMGLSIDFFSNSLGINAAALVFTAFCRPTVIRILKSKKEYVPGITPGIKDLGFWWFFRYSFVLIVLHHTALFFIEAFSFKDLIQTSYRIIFSSATTLVLVILAQLIFYKHDKKRSRAKSYY